MSIQTSLCGLRRHLGRNTEALPSKSMGNRQVYITLIEDDGKRTSLIRIYVHYWRRLDQLIGANLQPREMHICSILVHKFKSSFILECCGVVAMSGRGSETSLKCVKKSSS
jgi:hypothetical protein